MANKPKGERRIYISIELNKDRTLNSETIKIDTSLSDLTSYLNKKERRYLSKKLSANNNRTIYKGIHFEKRFF
tara:strand:- start:218 stop:436 length:219 start_codon:yes stop_codon:yes gene_type:complete